MKTAEAQGKKRHCINTKTGLRIALLCAKIFLGSNFTPSFALESGPGRTVVGWKAESHYENGKWIAGHRLNGDEAGRGLPGTASLACCESSCFE